MEDELRGVFFLSLSKESCMARIVLSDENR